MPEIDYGALGIFDMFERYRNMDQWTLNEGVFVTKMPYKVLPDDHPSSPFSLEKISIIQTGIERGDLKVEGYDAQKIENYKLSDPSATEFWYECFGGLKVSPFSFLEFVQRTDLYLIPEEFDHVKFANSTGDVTYCWTPANIDELQTLEDKYQVVSDPRDTVLERAVWDRWIQPIMNKHYEGGIEFQYYDRPEKISQLGIESVKSRATRKIRRIPRPLLQGADFFKEVVEQLLAGFTTSRGGRVNLVNLFYDFLVELRNKGMLPLFLAYMNRERGEELQKIIDPQEVSDKPAVPPIVYKSKDPKKKLEELLQKIIPDIDLFFEQLCGVKDSKEVDAERDYPSYAKEAFEKQPKQFLYLSMDDLRYSVKKNINEDKPDRVKGYVAQQMILRLDPALFMSAKNSKDPSLNIVRNTQKLLGKMNSIKRKMNII